MAGQSTELTARRGRDSGAADERAEIELHIALVSSLDGIRFVVIEWSGEALIQRLSGYVEAKAEDVLWPDSAGRVRRLLSQGRSDAAIEEYFTRVGDRWDAEFLHREVVQM